jgi:hypothetical protein
MARKATKKGNGEDLVSTTSVWSRSIAGIATIAFTGWEATLVETPATEPRE